MECCNIEKVKNVLKSLGKEQLNLIKEEDKQAEIVCPYCNKKYNFSEENLKERKVNFRKDKGLVDVESARIILEQYLSKVTK